MADYGGYAPPEPEDEPLELEHAIGYTGRYTQTLLLHPASDDTPVFVLGCTAVIGKLDDPHEQDFLRGHDEEICSLTVSKTGQMLATGQLGSTNLKEAYAPVIVWDMARREEIYFLKGLMARVQCIAFSPDSRFLAASDTEGHLMIWDMESGVLASNVKHCPVCFTLAWGNIAEVEEGRMNRHASYMFITSHENEVRRYRMAFDLRTMQYETSCAAFALPSMGLKRKYTHSVITPTDEFVLLATEQGDFSVFNIPNMIYRASVPVSSNGVQALCLANGGTVYAGAGDGKLKKLQGADLDWEEISETSLAGRVTSISMNRSQSFLLVGTSAGKMYRVRTMDLSTVEISESHTGAVLDVAFGARSDIFATISGDRSVRVWDLSDYSVRARSNVPASVPSCLKLVGDDTSVVGWADGALRAFDAHNGDMVWSLAAAHRGAVTSLCCNDTMIATGGQDGTLRVWSAGSREMLTQMAAHSKEVGGLAFDAEAPNLLHSASLDNTNVTSDLRKERRHGYHLMKGCAMTSISQRKDSELELVTGTADGCILFWDVDEPAPVITWRHPSGEHVTSVDVSASGRYLATAGYDQNVSIWDIRAGTLIASGVCHSTKINCVRWSPDEKQVISVGDDCCICVWNFFGDV